MCSSLQVIVARDLMIKPSNNEDDIRAFLADESNKDGGIPEVKVSETEHGGL